MKRFTETLKWADPWFRRLSAPAKMLWIYLLDHCDNIGLVELDLELASHDCGIKITESHVEEIQSRIQTVVGGKLFLPKFIPFQYGNLSPSCPAHKRVIEAVECHGLEKTPLGYAYPNARVEIPYKKGKEEERKKKEESEASEEGKAFAQWFRSTLPANVIPADGWQTQWAELYDDLVRLDGRNKDEIRRVCQWARDDDFWAGNFLSPMKLRKRDRNKVMYFDVFAQKALQPAMNGHARPQAPLFPGYNPNK